MNILVLSVPVRTLRSVLFGALVALLLSACGGGGSPSTVGAAANPVAVAVGGTSGGISGPISTIAASTASAPQPIEPGVIQRSSLRVAEEEEEDDGPFLTKFLRKGVSRFRVR